MTLHPMKRCPHCGHPEGLINCPVCGDAYADISENQTPEAIAEQVEDHDANVLRHVSDDAIIREAHRRGIASMKAIL